MILVASLLLHYVLTLGAVHNCGSTKTEPAGSHGTVKIKPDCHLTLTNIRVTGKVNIQGISASTCLGHTRLSIDNTSYCADKSSLKTIINVEGNDVVIKADRGEDIVIKYYHG